jgi:hypothetical protein
VIEMIHRSCVKIHLLYCILCVVAFVCVCERERAREDNHQEHSICRSLWIVIQRFYLQLTSSSFGRDLLGGGSQRQSDLRAQTPGERTHQVRSSVRTSPAAALLFCLQQHSAVHCGASIDLHCKSSLVHPHVHCELFLPHAN